MHRVTLPARTRGAPATSRLTSWVRARLPILALLAATGLVRIPFLFLPGHPFDSTIFRAWSATAAEDGLVGALHRPDMDYVGYNYVLAVIGFVYDLLARPDDLATAPGLLFVTKIPGLLGDPAVVALLYWITARWLRPPDVKRAGDDRADRRGRRLGLAAGAFYAFNPATIYATAYWGQIDSLITTAMLAALACLFLGRPAMAWSVLTVGFLLKPHPILLVPVLAWLTLVWHGKGGAARAALATAATLAAGLGYFFLAGAGGRVIEIYRGLFSTGEIISVSAWNLWWLMDQPRGSVRPGDIALAAGIFQASVATISKALLGGSVIFVWWVLGRRPTAGRVLFAAAFMTFVFFMFTLKMHERYLFPLFAFLAPLAASRPRVALLYAALSAAFLANLYGSFPFWNTSFGPGAAPLPRGTDTWVAAVELALFLALVLVMAREALRRAPPATARAAAVSPPEAA